MPGLPAPFINAVIDVETCAALLAEARKTGLVAKVMEAVQLGRSSTPMLIEAAEILGSLGHQQDAGEVLRMGLTLIGPTAPLQHAYSKHCRDAGDLDEAARWLMGAMLRARANAGMALELHEIELARGNRDAARDAAALAVRLRWPHSEEIRGLYRRLLESGCRQAALVAAMTLIARRYDDANLRREVQELLSTEPPFHELPPNLVAQLRLSDPLTRYRIASATAHDQLLSCFDRKQVISAATKREASGYWLDDAALWSHLKSRIDSGEPFSFIRGSDGEGRFVAATGKRLFPAFSEKDALASLGHIWWNWFGQHVSDMPAQELVRLHDMLTDAYRNAGILGVTSAAMFEHDDRHFAFRAALDGWLAEIGLPADQIYTEAAYNLFLNRRDPFFAHLLSGQRFIGAISPYDDLARRLAGRIGIPRFQDYVIPGETRLGREQERSSRGRHFPHVFDELMRTLSVPYPGACFIVAGGLLGKIYCERIRQLGGIAIDIGALADGWMGHHTRGEGFDTAVPNRLV